MPRRFRVNTPAVVSEIIDGEAVIMNLKSGAYFSARQVGSMLWDWVERGVPESTMVQWLQAAYEVPAELVTGDVERFIAELIKHDLIRELSAPASVSPVEPTAPTPTGTPFAAPVLEVHTDMQDLLLLDPIHDVDEEAGWPSPKPPEESVA